MQASTGKVILKGSERQRVPGAHAVGVPAPDERIEVTIAVRRRPSSQLAGTVKDLASRRVQERKYVSRAEFAKEHGADPADLEKVAKFAQDHHLVVLATHPERRTVQLSGSVADFENAFDVKLQNFHHPKGSYRGRTGPLHIPAELGEVVTAVLGLDNRPQARPWLRKPEKPDGAVRPRAAATSFTPVQVAELYDFPEGATGEGQCIGIIELGGGFRPADLRTYFKNLGVPLPNVQAASVDGGHNNPTGDPGGPDGEVMLDIEVAGAVAPKAKIVAYFAPNTDKGFLDAITQAVHDTYNNPSVLSISWGSAESNWTSQAMQAFDQALQDAAALGVTVCCAAGDNGSGDGVGDHLAHVDFPASSPHALACGGTRLQGSGSTITKEVVWDDDPNDSATGGGVSDEFDLPAYQASAKVPPSANPGGRIGRGVPDVAGDADPETGYQVRVDGTNTVIGGTSAVAPLWAGLIALLNQRLGKSVGFLNPLIYPLIPGPAFHDITSGNNGDYSAGPGWDACTGLGSPDGMSLLKHL